MTTHTPLFAAVDKMCRAMVTGKDPHITLAFPFLRDVSEAFARQHELIAEGGCDPVDREKSVAENAFFLLPSALWSSLAGQSMDARIGMVIDEVMCEIEAKNSSVKNVPPEVFGYSRIDRALLSGTRRRGLSAATGSARAAAAMLGRQRQAERGCSLG